MKWIIYCFILGVVTVTTSFAQPWSKGRYIPGNTPISLNGEERYLLSTHKRQVVLNGVIENYATESWVLANAPTYTAGDGLTLSATQFRIGGALTANRSFTGDFKITFGGGATNASINLPSTGGTPSGSAAGDLYRNGGDFIYNRNGTNYTVLHGSIAGNGIVYGSTGGLVQYSTLLQFNGTNLLVGTSALAAATNRAEFRGIAAGNILHLRNSSDVQKFTFSDAGLATQTITATNATFTGYSMIGSFNPSSGTATATYSLVDPTFNTTGTYVGNSFGYYYRGTRTSTTGLTEYAFRSDGGQSLLANSSSDVATANTRLDVRGVSGGNIITLKANDGTTRLTLTDGGSGTVTNGWVMTGSNNSWNSTVSMTSTNQYAFVHNSTMTPSGVNIGSFRSTGTINPSTGTNVISLYMAENTINTSGGTNTVNFYNANPPITAKTGTTMRGFNADWTDDSGNDRGLRIRNASTNASGIAAIDLIGDVATSTIYTASSTRATTASRAGSLTLFNNHAGGIAINAGNASGIISFSTGGSSTTNDRVTIDGSGLVLIGNGTVTASTRTDIRGVSSGSILRLANDANTERFDFLNDGSLQLSGSAGTSGQVVTSAGAGSPLTWSTIVGVTDGDKGDITISSSGTTYAIDNNVVTYAKMQDVSAPSKLMGRGDSGSGDPQEITLGSGLSMTGTTLSASGGIGGSTGTTDNAALRADGTGAATLQSSALVISDDGDLQNGLSGTSGTTRNILAEGSGSNIGYLIRAKGSEAVTIDNQAGLGSMAWGTPGRLNGALIGGEDESRIQKMDNATTSVLYPLDLYSNPNTDPSAGTGVGLKFTVETDDPGTNNEIAALIDVISTDITGGSEDFDMSFKTMRAGAAATEKFRITSTGIYKDANGYKHARFSSGSVGAGGSANLTFTYGANSMTAFADANYTVTASIVSASGDMEVTIKEVTASYVTFEVKNTGAGSETGTVHFQAVHD